MNLGHLYVVFTTLTRPPKDKLAICICPSSNLFIWINSDPRHHGVAQMPLAATDHDALTKACYLDCSRVTTFLPGELAAAKDRGLISPALAASIVGFITQNKPKTLPQVQFDLIVGNLSTLI